MAVRREFQQIIARDDIIVYENNKYYLVQKKNLESDEIYPKNEWTFKEVLNDIGVEADNL